MTAVNTSSAVVELKTDPYSSKGRRQLITGAKGTCDLLLMYDESEVRKIVKNCEALSIVSVSSKTVDMHNMKIK